MTEYDDGEVFDNEIKSAIFDTGILLEYLARAPNSRLQSQFEDTKKGSASSTSVSIAPPCKDYSEFLNRLTEIRFEYAERSTISEDRERDDAKLSNKAFLFWSRDFLSGLAAPATAETIRLTNAFVEYRYINNNKSNMSADNQYYEYSRIAINLVKTATRSQLIVVIATIFTIILSTYAFSGHQIISARNDAWERFNNVNKRLEELASTTSEHGGVTIAKLEDYKTHPAGGENSSADDVLHCDNLVIVSDLPTEKVKFNGSPLQFDLCQERTRTRVQLFAVAGQLIAWQRAFTNPFQSLLGFHPLTLDQDIQVEASTPNRVEAAPVRSASLTGTIDPSPAYTKNIPVVRQSEQWNEIAGLLESIAAAPSELFGRSYAVDQEFSHNKSICSDFGEAETGDLCAIHLAEKVEYYGTISDSIIGCLTLYILPCLYGFLGASVLSLRVLRSNVDNHLVRLTDRATIVQNGILGLVAGSVVGLFAAYYTGSAQSTGTLTVSGIAFLAGYNIPRLFSFLDSLSGRVFLGNEPRTGARTATP